MKAKSSPPMPDPLQGAQMFGDALSEIWKTMQGVNLAPQALSSLQSEYLSSATALWNDSLAALQPATGEAPPPKKPATLLAVSNALRIMSSCLIWRSSSACRFAGGSEK